MTAMTDANGNVTNYRYSLNGNLTDVMDALNNHAKYEYDEMGELISITQFGVIDGKADWEEAEELNQSQKSLHLTTYKRNILGEVEQVTDALGNFETYEYDKVGNIIKKVDKDGFRTSFEYMQTGQLEKITYADGKSVKLSYNPLRQLEEIKDWLGVTKMQLDSLGRVIGIVDYKDRNVQYELGKLGERTKIIYPNGNEVAYYYDDKMRLTRLKEGESQVDYYYNGSSRLREKEFSNGISTVYSYDTAGNLSELTHKDSRGILDRYSYQYDAIGNQTRIEKQRRGLREESGIYCYGYDALSRLISVEKEGEVLRSYQYDGFGNRTNKKEGEEETTYYYNAFNQLVMEKSKDNVRNFTYDCRGNLTEIIGNGKQSSLYEFSPLNKLTKAWNENGQIAMYEYNGLGHRVGKQGGKTGKTEYILDFTKNYYNLLQKEENGEVQSYVWDTNLVSTMVDNRKVYYCQDNLGSPIRLVYGNRETAEVYGYDEFGNDLYKNQGKVQPFGYTGYQMDTVSGTYFAQAREYHAGQGRFIAKDNESFVNPLSIKTLNLYIYCNNNPKTFVDPMGNDPEGVGIGFPFSVEFNSMDYFDASNLYGYGLNGLEIMNEGGKYWLTNAASNAVRPNNIGAGTWARIVASDIDDIARVNSKFSKGLNVLGYAGLAYEVGANVYDNVTEGESGYKIVNDAIVDTAISGGTMWVSVQAGASIGAVAGTVVPGIGNVVGAIGGAIVGVVIYSATDMIKIDGKSIREKIKDKINSWFD